MFQISLVFVGITLAINGIIELRGLDKKGMAFLNALVGTVIVLFSLYAAMTHKINPDFIRDLGGFLFGFTNLFIAADIWFGIDDEPMSWYCLLCTAAAVVLAIYFFFNAYYVLGGLWIVWSLLWLFTYLAKGPVPAFELAASWNYVVQGALTTFGVGFAVLAGILVI